VPGGGSKDERASVGRRGVRSDMCLVCRGELCIVLERNVCSGQGVGNGSIRTYRCGVGAAIRGRRRVHVLWVGRAAPLKQRNAFMLPFFRFPQFPSSLCYCSSSLVRRGLFRCCRRDVGFASRVCVGCSPSSMAVTSRQRYEGKWCAQVCAPKKCSTTIYNLLQALSLLQLMSRTSFTATLPISAPNSAYKAHNTLSTHRTLSIV